jgi:hypothetical protein
MNDPKNDPNHRPDDNAIPESSSDASDAASADERPEMSRAELEEDIEHTREELAETVDLLKAKLDVKSRTKSRASDVEARAAHQLSALSSRAGAQTEAVAARVTPVTLVALLGAAVGVVAAGVVITVLRRRHARAHLLHPGWRGR